MITVFSKYPLRPGLTREQAIAEIQETIHVYKDRPGVIRKYICLDWDRRVGYGVYLWSDRALAEKFYEMARPIIARQVGAEPEITFLDTPIIVDNASGEVIVDGVVRDTAPVASPVPPPA
ncbi:MAG: hypothetical protein RLY86_1100 [Pseudomonadota bacterium]|jgi:hypothetical protein